MTESQLELDSLLNLMDPQSPISSHGHRPCDVDTSRPHQQAVGGIEEEGSTGSRELAFESLLSAPITMPDNSFHNEDFLKPRPVSHDEENAPSDLIDDGVVLQSQSQFIARRGSNSSSFSDQALYQFLTDYHRGPSQVSMGRTITGTDTAAESMNWVSGPNTDAVENMESSLQISDYHLMGSPHFTHSQLQSPGSILQQPRPGRSHSFGADIPDERFTRIARMWPKKGPLPWELMQTLWVDAVRYRGQNLFSEPNATCSTMDEKRNSICREFGIASNSDVGLFLYLQWWLPANAPFYRLGQHVKRDEIPTFRDA